MRTLIIGANGYLGSAVAENFRAHGHDVAGLARNDESLGKLLAAQIEPVRGILTDPPALSALASQFDAVVFAPVVPFEEEGPALEALIDGLKGGGKALLYTSGTGVLSIPARAGEWHQENDAEDDPYEGKHWLSLRVETENLVRRAARSGVRAIVVRPPQIWGRGGSKQLPAIFESVEKTGAACYIGAGLNLYSHVHVDDLAELYRLALEKGTGGALYHAVAGEINWRTLAQAVAAVMDCETRSVSYDEACTIWEPMHADLFFGVSSRSRAVRSRAELGWEPTRFDIVDDVLHGSYREKYAPTTR